MSYAEKRQQMLEKSKLRKQQEIETFLNNVNVLYNNTDSVTIPSVEIVKETEKCYISYHIAKYPYALQYSVTMQKKEHPFDTYYSKKFFKNEIPQKYQKEFEELEQYFN